MFLGLGRTGLQKEVLVNGALDADMGRSGRKFPPGLVGLKNPAWLIRQLSFAKKVTQEVKVMLEAGAVREGRRKKRKKENESEFRSCCPPCRSRLHPDIHFFPCAPVAAGKVSDTFVRPIREVFLDLYYNVRVMAETGSAIVDQVVLLLLAFPLMVGHAVKFNNTRCNGGGVLSPCVGQRVRAGRCHGGCHGRRLCHVSRGVRIIVWLVPAVMTVARTVTGGALDDATPWRKVRIAIQRRHC